MGFRKYSKSGQVRSLVLIDVSPSGLGVSSDSRVFCARKDDIYLAVLLKLALNGKCVFKGSE